MGDGGADSKFASLAEYRVSAGVFPERSFNADGSVMIVGGAGFGEDVVIMNSKCH